MSTYKGTPTYKAVSPIKGAHNRTVGYIIKGTDGKQFEAPSSQIKQSILNGAHIKGLKLASDGRLIRDNATTGVSLSAAYQLPLTSSKIKVLTNENLDNYVIGARRFKNRDYVQSIVDYITNDDYFRIFIVHGIRRTGKTVSLLHSIDAYHNTNSYKKNPRKIVYITITSDTTFEALLAEISQYRDCVIYIDEITRVIDILSNASFLSDILCGSNNLKIIISGTDSFVFPLALSDRLYGRAYIAHSTYISYAEYIRIFNLEQSKESYTQYRTKGAIYSADFMQIDKALNSINFAIIRNIYNTINRNSDYISKDRTYEKLLDFDEYETAYLVYNIIVTATSPKSVNKLNTSLNNLGKVKRKLIAQYCNIADDKVIKGLSAIRNTTMLLFLQALQDLDIIRRYQNIAYYAINDKDKCLKSVTDQELGITVPALLHSLLTVDQTRDSDIAGIENENTVLTNIKFELSNIPRVLNVGYAKYTGVEGSHEIDAVVMVEGSENTREYVLIEVKSGAHADISYARHLITTDMPAVILKHVHKRIVIYSGETVEKQINGYSIHYINITDFLMNIKHWVLS